MSTPMLKKIAIAFSVIDRHNKPCFIIAQGGFSTKFREKEPCKPMAFCFHRGPEKPPGHGSQVPGAMGVSGASSIHGQSSASIPHPVISHEPGCTHGRAQHPLELSGVTEKYPVNWVWRISFFLTGQFKAFMTRAQTRTGEFPLKLVRRKLQASSRIHLG